MLLFYSTVPQVPSGFSQSPAWCSHLSLQTLESPCGKGFEGSERAFWPLTALSLPSHSKRDRFYYY